jgi:hypothetical protein
MGIVGWIRLDPDRDKWWALASKVLSLRVPLNVQSSLSGCRTLGVSRRTRLYTVS